jgi:hypothetical protein
VVSVKDERGQAVLAVVLALGIAASAMVGLRAAQDRIIAGAHADRAGEAAVEAAAQSVADAYAARPSTAKALVFDPRVIEAARSAAEELAMENGESGIERMEVSCAGDRIEVRLALTGRAHHAGFRAPECSQP